MTDRTVTVRMQAKVDSYMASMSAAGRATEDLAKKVDVAKGRAAQGFHSLGVAGVAFGSVVAGGFALAVKASADFESKMALVRTLSHATGAEMAQLSNAALHVGQAYGFSATQVADAEAELVKAGVSVKDIMGGALTGALTLASAGQTDVAEATTIAATAMTQFGLAGKDVPHIADLLAAGADKALGSVGDLGYALDQAGPQAHQFHVSLEETVGTLAAFAQAGQVGERGGTIFTQMLLKLAAPSKQSADILKNLGISIYGANGQFVGMANLAGQLQTKMGGLTEAQRNTDLAIIFGQRAIKGANILYQEGAKGVQDWTSKVNDQGFAALQAAGKMNSLSGDVTKLHTALQTAFIGVGEGGQGPLRGMVQDVTQAVNAWNGLPGPVRGSAEALTLVAGGTALAAGAALLLIPKVRALDTALVDMSGGAVTARGALAGLGKAAGVALALAAVYEATSKLANLVGPTAPNVDRVTASLQSFAANGRVAGQMTQDFGADLSDLGGQLKKVADPSTLQRLENWSRWNPVERLAGTGADLAAAKKNVTAYDDALAGMVKSGQATSAADFWQRIESAAKAQGISMKQLAHIFPQYATALVSSKASAELAGNGIDQFGNKVGAAAKKTKSATDAAKHYSDALHALADPLFALNQALQGVTDAQDAARKAVHKYGEDSPQARQANLDLASSALDAEAAARTLAASVKDGSVSIGAARKYLKAWVADGLLTKQQADDVSASFDHLIGRAQTISGLHPHMTVTADTSQAEAALTHLFNHIGQVINRFLDIGSGAINSSGGVGSTPYGPAVPKGKTKPKASQSTSGGSTTTPPTTSDAGYYVPGGGSSGGSGGSGGSGRAGTKTRPPTVQEIVHAILTGTIPPSIDKLSHVLQTEISHLSTVVGNAEQYRSTIRSGLLGYASLSNNSGTTDSFGDTMTVGVNSYLKGRYAQLKQFGHLRHKLKREGAGKLLLGEFTTPADDAQMLQLLSGGSQAVRQASRLEGRIHHLAGVESGQAAADKYGQQMVNLMQRLPQQLARDIAAQLKHQRIYVDLAQVSRAHGRRIRNHS